MATTGPSCVVLRQLAATLAYRAAKVLRDPPPEFGSQEVESRPDGARDVNSTATPARSGS
ncbi:MAG: hypothetical protein CK533_01580 [Acidobacterium sp.]|nr:MAG: hypothetical protein CK533_01580 [Acidobacterium sp.]